MSFGGAARGSGGRARGVLHRASGPSWPRKGKHQRLIPAPETSFYHTSGAGNMAFAGMEWVLVLVVVVVLFFGGAKVIPKFAQSIGRAKGEYERGKLEVERELAAERAKAPSIDSCVKCGSKLTADDVKCLNCGSVRERPMAPSGVGVAARQGRSCAPV